MIGDVVGNYRVVGKLGSGGMGEVWAAEHLLLGQKVAIKVLHADVSTDEAVVKRFFDEARAAAQLADPGIVAVIDFGWHGGGAYVVMEQLAGESLRKRLEAGRMPLAHALRIAIQVALTMSVAHARGIIHRDLKPDNIFLVPDAAMPGGERAKILDFGIAKLIVGDHTASNTRSDVVMGTPTHMSPEQCRGAAGVDHRTDIYALGCILYQLVCGRLPFLGPTMSDTIASHLLEPPPVPSALAPSVAPAIDAIALRCLAKAPDERFASMTDLARALADAAGTPLAVATLPPVLPPSRRDRAAPAEASGVGTTLGTSAAESIGPRAAQSGRWIVAAVAATAMVAAIVVFFAIGRPEPTGSPLDARAGARAVDAAPAADAASVDTARADAATASADVARLDAAPAPDAHRRKRHGHESSGSAEYYENR